MDNETKRLSKPKPAIFKKPNIHFYFDLPNETQKLI